MEAHIGRGRLTCCETARAAGQMYCPRLDKPLGALAAIQEVWPFQKAVAAVRFSAVLRRPCRSLNSERITGRSAN
jgi:hypothetical protein